MAKKLKTRKVTTLEVDYHDINVLIQDFLKRKFSLKKIDYECVAYEEWHNDSYHPVTVEKELPSDYDMENWKKGNFYGIGSILNWMCEEGEIETGDYTIHVCW